MSAKLYRVILPVPAIDRAEVFYRNVLEQSGQRVSPGRHYFDLGGTILALYDPEADGDRLGEGWRHHPAQYVYISLDDLGAALLRIRENGGTVVSEIAVRPWGEESFYWKDPFGNPVAFVKTGTEFTGSRDEQ